MLRPISVGLLLAACAAGCTSSQGGPSNLSTQVVLPHVEGSSMGTTVTALRNGGALSIAQYAGVSGTITYAPNDAPSGAALRLTVSGEKSLLDVPIPADGTPVLYLETSVTGASAVTFTKHPNLATLTSTAFQADERFEVYIYEGRDRVQTYAVSAVGDGTLTFQTPLSGVRVVPATPLVTQIVAINSGGSPRRSGSKTPTDWDSFGFDLQRTGYNPVESTVGINNVGAMQQVWSLNVGSNMIHEPVYAYGVKINGGSTNVLYAGSAYGSTMVAVNAASGAILWKVKVPHSTFSCNPPQKSEFSINETPAIDRAKNLLYFADGHNQVHALDLSTGKEADGWPLKVASFKPVHNFMHGGMTYNPANGLLYFVTGSTCDISPWYGRIVAISTKGSHPAVVGTFFTMSGGSSQGASGGGIWGPGGGSIDPASGDVYVATGNADTSKGAQQNAPYAEQVIALTPTLAMLANNYPPNIPSITGDDDFDFGATPLLFRPAGCPPLLAALNKSGVFELYDRRSIDSGPIEYINMSVPTDQGEFIGVPAFDPATGYVYVGLPTSEGIYQPGLAAFEMQSNCTLNPTPVWAAAFGPAGSPSQTERRSPISIANGVVYVSNFTGDTEFAFNAATGTQLWETALSAYGNEGTVVANGMVFVSADDGTITAWAPAQEAKALRKHVARGSIARTPVRKAAPATAWGPWTERPQKQHWPNDLPG